MTLPPSGSLLLAQLPSDDCAHILSHSAAVTFEVGQAVWFPEIGNSTLFIESGFASVILRVSDIEMEVGLVGREAMLGLPTLLGSDVAPYRGVVRHAMTARHIAAETLRKLALQRPAIGSMIIRSIQAGSVQVIFNSFANAHASVPVRVARWIAMACDRVGSETLLTTHNVISAGIGVERSGVTIALRDLQAANILIAKRGTIYVLDPGGLRRFAGSTYGQAEAAFRSLFPQTSQSCEIDEVDGIELFADPCRRRTPNSKPRVGVNLS